MAYTTTIPNEMLLRPDVYLVESQVGGQALQLAGTGAAGMVGVCDKGEIGKAHLVTSLSQFYRDYGADMSYPLVRGARAFFNMGGSRLYVVRTSRYASITSPTGYDAEFARHDIDAQAIKETYTLALDTPTGGTYKLGSPYHGFTGDLAHDADDSTITAALEALYGSDNVGVDGGTISFNEKVGQAHLEAVFSLTYSNGGTPSLTGPSVSEEDDAGDEFVVKAKTPGTWGDQLTVIISGVDTYAKEFLITVKDANDESEVTVEKYRVSWDENAYNYVETVINHQYRGSRYIQVTWDAPSGADDGELWYPEPGTYHLTGGDNAITGISDSDYVGDKGAGNGIYAFDNVWEMLTISHPGVTSNHVISSSLMNVLTNTNRMPPQTDFYVYDLEEGMNPQQALDFIALGLSVGRTGYEGVYYPWLDIEGVHEPAAPFMQGAYAHNDRTRGVWQAPAGTKFPIGFASGLAYDLTHGDQELLNPYGINCIVRKPFYGICPFGARTLNVHYKDRYIQARRLVNLIKKTLYNGTQQFLFELNAPIVWQRIEETAHGLLSMLHSMGAFGRPDNPEQCFFAKCDEETNPPELREQGVCVCKIGIVPPKPIEFLIFNVLLYPEGSLPEGIEKYLST